MSAEFLLSPILNWLITALPRLLAHLAGLIVAIILLRKSYQRGVVPALVAFGGLLLVDLGGLALLVLATTLQISAGPFGPMPRVMLLYDGSLVCCNLIAGVAWVLLAVAFWQALADRKAETEHQQDETPV